MKTIPSFTIDHIRLLRGIYVSRKDQIGDEVVTTFDIRMKEPNREPALGQGALHTIEHLAATYLRNHPTWADKIVYWGPMGCLTGNYPEYRRTLRSVSAIRDFLLAIFLRTSVRSESIELLREAFSASCLSMMAISRSSLAFFSS